MTALKLRLTVTLVLLLSTTISSQEFEQINLVHDGIEREYLVYVPNEYDASISIPLVLNFHGFGGTAYDHYKYTSDMTSLADTANFLLVYPQGAAGSDGYSHWNIATGDYDNGATINQSWNFGNPPHAISSGNADGNGYGNFEYAVPSGYYSLCTKNLAEYG